ncbi:MAG: hypothetical protein LBT01_08020 [Spirochaetaceae bacterium]|nr:hypothetical protein [Spirochaetaceae bacterium]
MMFPLWREKFLQYVHTVNVTFFTKHLLIGYSFLHHNSFAVAVFLLSATAFFCR